MMSWESGGQQPQRNAAGPGPHRDLEPGFEANPSLQGKTTMECGSSSYRLPPMVHTRMREPEQERR
jgi:hypothetical protein